MRQTERDTSVPLASIDAVEIVAIDDPLEAD